MVKDNTHDYTTEAFRYYALYKAGDIVCADKASLDDIKAVEELLEALDGEPDGAAVRRCLEIVYFAQPWRTPQRGAIAERARYASKELGLSESVIYRKLRWLRHSLAIRRGLRVERSGGLSIK